MKLNKKQIKDMNWANTLAYKVLKLCMVCLLIITLLRHSTYYEPNDTLWWLTMSMVLMLTFKMPLWADEFNKT